VISQERLEAIVRNFMMDGLNANQISHKTGVPIERVQRTVHQLNGKDPKTAARETRSKARQADRQLFGSALSGPRQLGPNRRRGSYGKGRGR
jgi:hypothetical protein